MFSSTLVIYCLFDNSDSNCMSSLEKCLFRSLGYFLIFYFAIELFIYFGYEPLSGIKFANVFTHSIDCVFILWMFSLVYINVLVQCNPICLILPVPFPKKFIAQINIEIVPFVVFYYFTLSGLICESLTHLDLIVVYSTR